MPQISQSKKDKIAEQILHYLFSTTPEAKFTSQISREIARDEEFTKFLLQDLQKKNIIISIKKNPKGKDYTRRQRWRLSDTIYQIYQKKQNPQSNPNYNNLYNSQDLDF